VDTFRAFSALHFATVAIIATLTVIAILVRRRRPPHPVPPGAIERAVACSYLSFWLGTFVWLRFGPLYDPATTYPLQLCHWCGVAAAGTLLSALPVLRAMTYFCGLGLCTQAMITPSLVEGPALFPFWFFWATHGLVVGGAIYDVAARGYRPTPGHYAIACAIAAFYVLLVLPIDLAFGWNYGFVGPSRPDHPSIVDVLGPWPQRLAAIAAIAAAAMALLLAPWLIVRRSPSARR